MAVDLYPHQQAAVDKMHNGCILWGGTGTGKSRTAVAYYLKNEAPKDVYVITTAKKRETLDWVTDFARGGVGPHRGATTAGVLKVDSWNNIKNYKNVKGAFFIFDEQRLVGSGAWVHAFERIAKDNAWVLLSATPGDTWLDYMAVFIANGFYKNRTEFKREHVVYNTYSKFPKVDHYVKVGKLIKHRNVITVHMPYVRQTTSQTTIVPVQYDEFKFARLLKERWNPFEDRPVRNVSELFSCMRRITYSNPSRLFAVRKLMKQHDRLIVFYNFDYELHALRTLADEITVAELNGKKHELVPDTDRWVYLVQYAAGSEAWDCITTNAMVFYSLTYSYKMWKQAHGRIDRLDTDYSVMHYYILLAESAIDKAVLATLKQKKSFNEAKFVKTNSSKVKLAS